MKKVISVASISTMGRFAMVAAVTALFASSSAWAGFVTRSQVSEGGNDSYYYGACYNGWYCDPFGHTHTGNYGSVIYSAGMGPGLASTWPDSYTVSGTTDTTGTATSSFDQVNVNSGLSQGYAAADLSNGSLHAVAQTSYAGQSSSNEATGGTSSVQAEFGDTLHFNIPGATANTMTQIEVVATLDGTQSHTEHYAGSALNWQVITGGGNLNVTLNDNGLLHGGTTDWYVENAVNYGWATSVLNDASTSNLVFDGFYDVYGSDPTLGLDMRLSADSAFGGIVDYGNTAKLNIIVPNGVTYTSDSGVFLTANSTPSNAVPEPASWLLAGAGFVLLGFMGWRKRNSKAAGGLAAA